MVRRNAFGATLQGLVELIVLNIGKDAGIIDNTCFGMLVLMALITYVVDIKLYTCQPYIIPLRLLMYSRFAILFVDKLRCLYDPSRGWHAFPK